MSAQKSSVCAVMLFLVLGWVDVEGAQFAPAAPAAETASTAVPRLVKFSGAVKDAAGNPPTGIVGMTFAASATPAQRDPSMSPETHLSAVRCSSRPWARARTASHKTTKPEVKKASGQAVASLAATGK